MPLICVCLVLLVWETEHCAPHLCDHELKGSPMDFSQEAVHDCLYARVPSFEGGHYSFTIMTHCS